MAGNSNYTQTSLLLHFDGANNSTTITDTSINPKSFSVIGSAVISTTKSVFGGSSLSLPGVSNSYVTAPDHPDFNFGAGDFTIRFRVNFVSVSGFFGLQSKPSSSNYSPYSFFINGDSQIRFYSSSNGSSWDIANGVSLGSVTTNTDYAVCVTRSGTSIRLFLNGSLITTVTSSASLLADITAPLKIGGLPGQSGTTNAYIDEFSFIKGKALYTAGYTVETSADLDYAGQLSGTITESLAVTNWRVTATKCGDGSSAGSATSGEGGTTYTVNCKTIDACTVTIEPKVDGKWAASTAIALNYYAVPTAPDTTPRLYKCTTAGTTSTTEPTWPTSGTVTDGSVVWTYIADLDDGMFKSLGTKIPA